MKVTFKSQSFKSNKKIYLQKSADLCILSLSEQYLDMVRSTMDKKCNEIARGDAEFKKLISIRNNHLDRYDELDIAENTRADIDELITAYNDVSDQRLLHAFLAGKMDAYEKQWGKAMV